MNRWLPSLLGGGALYLGAGLATAQGINVQVNGQPVPFTGAQPAQIQGRLFVPLRGVLEQMGATLIWDASTRTIVGSRGDRRFELPIGAYSARVNGQNVTLDVPAQIMRGTTMVPLRFVSEALGAGVKWQGDTQTVQISTEPIIDGDFDPTRDRNGGATGRPGTSLIPGNRGNTLNPPPQPGNGAGAAAPVIQSFRHMSNGAIKAGSILEVEMEGSPGGQATFDVVGVSSGLPLREVQPGRYTGQLRIPGGMNVQNARIFGQLVVSGQRAPIVQAGNPITIDAQPPQILNLSPAQGSVVNQARPDIYAEFKAEDASELDRNSVRLIVNGKDVTNNARIAQGFIFYEPSEDLNGTANVEVRVADRAGNLQTAKSSFRVQPQAGGLTDVTHNAEKPVPPGQAFTVTAKGTPGGTAVFDLPNVAEGVKMTETSPGVYTGSYTVKQTDKAYNVPVAVRFVSSGARPTTVNAAKPVSLAGGNLTRPMIIEPKQGSKLKDSVTIVGRAEPRTTVRVTLSSSGRLFGVLPVEGTNLTQEVQVGEDGIFRTDPLPLPNPVGAKNLQFKIDVMASDPSGRTSPTMTVTYAAQ